MKVFPSLISRRKNHFHNLPCGISVIIGNNGYIWISPPLKEIIDPSDEEELENYNVNVSFKNSNIHRFSRYTFQ